MILNDQGLERVVIAKEMGVTKAAICQMIKRGKTLDNAVALSKALL